MDEIARFQPGYLCHHLQQQGIGSDVERHSQETVRTALVHLQAQSSVSYIELEKHVAGRQVHILQVGHVPGIDDDSSGIRILADGFHSLGNLVDESSFIVRP